MVEAATEFRKNGFNDEDAAQLAQVATWIQVEYMATYIKNRVNCWKPKSKDMAISNQDCIEIYNKAQRLSKAIKTYS